LLGLLFSPEDRDSTFLQNVSELLLDYSVTAQMTVLFIGTAVRTSDSIQPIISLNLNMQYCFSTVLANQYGYFFMSNTQTVDRLERILTSVFFGIPGNGKSPEKFCEICSPKYYIRH
jgi:hypothetical protein